MITRNYLTSPYKFGLNSLLCLFLLLSASQVSAQERVKAGKAYRSGDTITAPLYGIKLILPEHWNGFLTRGTEVFTLESDTSGVTNIMVFPTEENLKKIETRWNEKVELSPGLELLPIEAPRITQGKLKSEFNFSGSDDRMGYALASCGDFGFCYTAFLIIDKSNGPAYRDVLDKLSGYISFYKPTLTDYYGDYDWEQNLKGKYLVSYESAGGYSVKQNHLWLCQDGTFEARIKRKGGFKDTTGKYKGKLKGIYQVEGVGGTGKIHLNFEKLSPLEFPLEIKEEVIYMNGLRYSVSNHDQCK